MADHTETGKILSILGVNINFAVSIMSCLIDLSEEGLTYLPVSSAASSES